ncbi:hypothetical protein A2U01_0110242, partial [Trifolium medium]|nr:hypothetical protein [Trifolium medium]
EVPLTVEMRWATLGLCHLGHARRVEEEDFLSLRPCPEQRS